MTGIEELQLSPARRIQLAQEYDIDAWLEPALIELADRKECLSVEEVVEGHFEGQQRHKSG